MTDTPNPLISEKMFRLWIWVFAGLGLWLCYMRLVSYTQFTYDDTYIVLRYAANFLNHGVLHWNVGEAVEGFTSPLHLLLIIPFGKLGMDLVDAVHLVNLIFYAAFGGFCFLALRRHINVHLALLLSLLAASNGNLILWVWGGLESPVTVALLTASVGAMLHALLAPPADDKTELRRAVITALLFALTAFCRLDTAVFAAAAAGGWLLRNPRKFWPFMVFCAVFGASILAQTVWRWLEYGDVLPNTFYAKVTGSVAANVTNGFSYVRDALLEPPWLMLGGIAAMLYGLSTAWWRFALYGLVSLGISAAYIIWVGGDFMPGSRFMLPWLPFCVMGLALAVQNIYLRHKGAAFGVVFCLLVSGLILPSTMRSLDVTAIAGLEIGDWVQKNWKKGSTVALNAAGGIPYRNFDKTFIDMLGLNDKTIAKRDVPDLGLNWQKVVGHAKGDGAYVLRRKPDYIVMASASGDSGEGVPVMVSDVEIKANPEFARCYKHETKVLKWPADIADRAPPSDAGYGVFIFSYYERTCPK